ncbi:arsenate reductase/protein-tyrosine-phosphatase family protein [Robertkochia aurantiaca]|uniref:arsenate reductase/protein-tyrosine-phosphatase family protein n=1 Tax=Robertkochia aurantiaca TaxID=2873700 RepID=UPI001CCEED31|nr:low molecular weight phosphatase family protein [Robertkochia sp. 3YJGBD-33]
MPKTDILFLCTGNYYRSRFAEILLNEIAKEENIPAKISSRGLRISANNKGALSPYTTIYMSKLGIDLGPYLRMPLAFEPEKIDAHTRIIALDEEEHRPMLEKNFAQIAPRVEYWNFVDEYIVGPETVLPELEKKVRDLVIELK